MSFLKYIVPARWQGLTAVVYKDRVVEKAPDRRWRCKVVDGQGRGVFNYAGPSGSFEAAMERAQMSGYKIEVHDE